MSIKRALAVAAIAFLVSQVLAVVVHGVKQLSLELLSSLLIGATIGLASGSRVPGPSIRTADQGWTD